VEVLTMGNEPTSWNDDRLDELNLRVENGFAKAERERKEGFAAVDRQFAAVDRRFIRLEGEMKDEFTKVRGEMKEGFAEVKGEIRFLGERFDRLSHALMMGALTLAAGALTAFAGLVVAVISLA
jgi:hypothetical protein